MIFRNEEFLPPAIIGRLTDTRIQDPELPVRIAKERMRRDMLAPSGRLCLFRAEDPDRAKLLAIALRGLMSDAMDGLIAPMDVLEDLLMIEGFVRHRRGPTLLDGKLLIPDLNPAGPITGPSPAACAYWYFDAVRVGLIDPVACSHVVSQANSVRMPTILETSDAFAVGDSTRHLWLAGPAGWRARQTSLPVLLTDVAAADLQEELAGAENIRGAIVSIRFDLDPLVFATGIGRIVHSNLEAARAFEIADARVHTELDRITRWL